VGGRDLWFATTDLPLRPAAEAFVCAALVPALDRGQQLRVVSEVDATFAGNLERLIPLVAAWWDVPQLHPCLSGTRGEQAIERSPAGDPPARTALMFSGGADSFYSLLQGPYQPRTLVFVRGFDIARHDEARWEAAERSFRRVAAAVGARAAVIETNLREHACLRRARWDRAHGGALAAIGHLLGPDINRLVISSSRSYQLDGPHGSHWSLDPLWTSSQLRVIHRGADLNRYGKLGTVGNHPLLRDHLRVCWENGARTGNCSRCEKCVRNMIYLQRHGYLRGYRVFDQSVPLTRRIDDLPEVPAVVCDAYQRILPEMEPAIRQALTRLIARSRAGHQRPTAAPSKSPLVWWRRAKRVRPARPVLRRDRASRPPKAGPWDGATLSARIRDGSARIRHAGGSPNSIEVQAYASALPTPDPRRGLAVVMGMTPELRSLATSRYATTLSMDRNGAAIDLYRDWLDPEARAGERVVCADWFDLANYVTSGAQVVLGDGVFGNLPDAQAYRELLAVIAAALGRDGRFVTRHAMIPDGFDAASHTARRLRDRFRAGEIDEDEFGFCTRLFGHHGTCYDPRRSLLHNAALFDRCAADHRAGRYTDAEYAAIGRYVFRGDNCILPQHRWESLLEEAGFQWRIVPGDDKLWSTAYAVYACEPCSSSALSRISSAASISRSLTVSGGESERTLPSDTLKLSPSSRQR
jgi:hypothetical protein